jgi:carboxypeptidase C (cathepsin A)
MGLLLILLALVVACGGTKSSHAVPKVLPGQLEPTTWTQYTGYVEVNETAGANLFYWFHGSQSNPSQDPLVLWLTGGPGCSAELAVLFENGPWNVNDKMQLTPNPYSWNTGANVLYVDSPAGTGYSYLTNPNDYVTNEFEMADNLYTVLQAFLSMHPEYQTLPFFVFGESYAGHYVPAIAERILKGNSRKSGININFKGLAIGNGMSQPLIQYGEYADFSLSHGLISAAVKEQVDALYAQCKQGLQSGDPNAVNVCQNVPGTIQVLARFSTQFICIDYTAHRTLSTPYSTRLYSTLLYSTLLYSTLLYSTSAQHTANFHRTAP